MNTFCTIITADHMHYALAVRASLLAFGGDFHYNILVAEKREGLKELIEKKYANTTVFFSEDICSDGFGKAIYAKYYGTDMDAFRWSMKPVFIHYLLSKGKFEKVIYTDCDIHFYNGYHFLLDQLDDVDVLLTPHWRAADPHKDLPNFEILYTSGIYNGGFIGAAKNALKAMEWWAMACEFICIKDATKGMFVDQVHLNLLPVYFDKVGIVKHRGCNVANWNMVECFRTSLEDKTAVTIAGMYPIIFVHYTKSTIDGILSGIDSLLYPYLEQYYALINQFATDLGLNQIEVDAPQPKVLTNAIENKKITNLKRALKKILK